MQAITRCRIHRVLRVRTLCGGSLALDYRHDKQVLLQALPHRCDSRGSSRCYSSGRSASNKNGHTFVSKHRQLPLKEVCEWLKNKNLEYKVQGTEANVKHCPFCHPTGGKSDNLWKLFIGSGEAGGAYFCHRCQAQGSWYDLKQKVGGVDIGPLHSLSTQTHAHSSSGSSSGKQQRDAQPEAALPLPNQRLVRTYPGRLMHQRSNAGALDYLVNKRGLSRLVLQKYGVGCTTASFAVDGGYRDAQCVTFPWMALRSEMSAREFEELLTGAQTPLRRPDEVGAVVAADAAATDAPQLPPDSVITRVKLRAIDSKGLQKLDPKGGRWGLFGWHTVPEDATSLVLTEGEFDAMAVHQATGLPAVSLPNGCGHLPVPVLPMLERFDTIYLWMDADGPGQEGAAKFAKKLGDRRVRIVRPLRGDPDPAKDANEALLKKKDLMAMIDAAVIMPHEDILRFRDLRDSVMHEILHPDEFAGTAVKSFPLLSSLIKGFRRGELSVLTGGTGVGKTTLLTQFSLDMAHSGVNTLWGSFEVKNTRLMKKMLQQFAGKPLERVMMEAPKTGLLALMDRFEQLPLLFMGFHGGTDVDLTLEAMDYAVYVNDVEHIILDNLQFMLSRNGSSRLSWDKFDAQDLALEKFRKFATDRNVHITLVIHPRKEEEGKAMSMQSVFGSAKMTQEADLVMILQRSGDRKSLEVKKNRYDGAVGDVTLYFEKDSASLRESSFSQSVVPPAKAAF